MEPPERCLICYQNCVTPPPKNPAFELPTISQVSKELYAVFILRNIFEVPHESIKIYLKSGTNPSEWIVLCENCKGFLEKGKRLYKEILEAQRRFRKVKGDIIQCLRRNKKRVENQGDRRRSRGDGGALRITDETRRFVSENNYSESLVDPFVGGDCQAEKLLFSSNVVVTEVTSLQHLPPLPDHVKVEPEDWNGEESPPEDFEDTTMESDSEPESLPPRSKPKKRPTSSANTNTATTHEDLGCSEDTPGEIQWSCSCGRKYSAKEKLRRHVREANLSPSEMFGCPLCEKQFRRGWDVKRHMRHHKDEAGKPVVIPQDINTFRNLKLDGEFSDNDNQSNCSSGLPQVLHTRTIHVSTTVCKMADGTEYWKCSCGKIYLSETSLQQHVNDSNDGVGSTIITCPVCDILFKRRFDRNRHMKKVHNMDTAAVPDNSQASQMSGSINSREEFGGGEKHEQLGLCEDSEGKEAWHCTCGKSYTSQPALHRHVKEQNMDPSKWIACEYCGKKFRRLSELTRHVGNVHEKKKAVCDTCGRVFKDGETLRDHQREECCSSRKGPDEQNETEDLFNEANGVI